MANKLIVANWKANKNRSETIKWWNSFSAGKFNGRNFQAVICPPYVHIFLTRNLIKKTRLPFPITVGAQDLSPYPDGTYTGQVTARMLENKISHVIIGHSERRRWFGETNQQVALKTLQAVYHNIIPIVSINRDNFRQQLSQFDDETLEKMMVMYEPPDAISVQRGPIGQGHPTEAKDVADMISIIKKIAPAIPILYGGSVKSGNAKEFSQIKNLAGIVVGTASLNPDEFIRIINQI